MPTYNPNPDTIREEIFSVAKNDNSNGLFLSNFYGSTMDGSDIADYMESIGFIVTDYRDTGTCGLVTLSCGVQISTNGACIRCLANWRVELLMQGSHDILKYNVKARTRHEAENKAINQHIREKGIDKEWKLCGTYETNEGGF